MKQRIRTALIALPIALALLCLGGWLFALGITVLAVVGWKELRTMLLQKDCRLYYGASGLGVVLLLVAATMRAHELMLPLLTVIILAVMLEALYHYEDEHWIANVAMSVFAVFYVGMLFSHFIFLRELSGNTYQFANFYNMELGEALLWVVLFGTWASDTFAYFFGVAFGKHRLLEAVSPKKSVEGAVAGFFGTLLVVSALGSGWLGYPLSKIVGLGLVIGFFAPLGDLVESNLKRSCAIKDSGNFFPGHGGVLDRCDSLLFAVPLAYYYIKLFLL